MVPPDSIPAESNSAIQCSAGLAAIQGSPTTDFADDTHLLSYP